ncbi:unnamed protein product [Lathyrus sativus]|nr:unnamed protein product [Lathyrus sativus]
MSCMKDQHLKIYDFVPDCYKKEQYVACYAHVIYPLNGEALWTKTGVVDLQPPPIKRQAERPKKKRNREAREMVRDEAHIKKAKHGIKCSRCHKDGHNKVTCKLPQPQASSSQVQDATSQQPSQANTSQSPPVAISQPPSQAVTSQPSPPVATSQPPPQSVTSQPPPPVATSQPPPKTKKKLHKGGKPVSSQPSSILYVY